MKFEIYYMVGLFLTFTRVCCVRSAIYIEGTQSVNESSASKAPWDGFSNSLSCWSELRIILQCMCMGDPYHGLLNFDDLDFVNSGFCIRTTIVEIVVVLQIVNLNYDGRLDQDLKQCSLWRRDYVYTIVQLTSSQLILTYCQ